MHPGGVINGTMGKAWTTLQACPIVVHNEDGFFDVMCRDDQIISRNDRVRKENRNWRRRTVRQLPNKATAGGPGGPLPRLRSFGPNARPTTTGVGANNL